MPKCRAGRLREASGSNRGEQAPGDCCREQPESEGRLAPSGDSECGFAECRSIHCPRQAETMSAVSSDRSAGNAADQMTPGLQGFSQFITRVLDQLSLSSWLPAALLVGATALICEVYSQDAVDLPAAVERLTSASWGLLVAIAFALVATTMLLQAFELPAIRLLEGYWPPLASTLGITGGMVRLQVFRRSRSLRRIARQRRKAFRSARERMLDSEEDAQLVNYHKRIVYGEPLGEVPEGVEQAAAESPWEQSADPHRLRAVEAAERAAKGFPLPHRVMPTRLGNALRAGEDTIENNEGGPLRTFVIRNWHLIPLDVRDLHDQYRNRLDLYCTLVFVCAVLAGGGLALLSKDSHRLAGVVCIVFFCISAGVSYRAAITSAEGYTGALNAIDDAVGARRGVPGA